MGLMRIYGSAAVADVIRYEPTMFPRIPRYVLDGEVPGAGFEPHRKELPLCRHAYA